MSRRALAGFFVAAEIAGGLAVLPRRTRRLARWWLPALLVAVEQDAASSAPARARSIRYGLALAPASRGGLSETHTP